MTYRWWREHSLSITLAGFLLAFMAVSFATGVAQFTVEQPPFTWGAFWTWWTYETVTSLEADVFGFLLIVLLSKKLWERGSSEGER